MKTNENEMKIEDNMMPGLRKATSVANMATFQLPTASHKRLAANRATFRTAVIATFLIN